MVVRGYVLHCFNKFPSGKVIILFLSCTIAIKILKVYSKLRIPKTNSITITMYIEHLFNLMLNLFLKKK